MAGVVPVVYLAHPIDQGRLDQEVTDVISVLVRLGCVIYDPAQAWACPSGISPLIHTANVRVLATVDFMVAVLDPAVLSVGTVIEIATKAKTHPGSVVVYGPNLLESVVLAALGVPIVKGTQQLAKKLADMITEDK